jgi:hypothetical protein
MSDAAFSLDTLAERFAQPAVRVMVRELSHLARDVERGRLAWPQIPPAFGANRPLLPGLESIEAALSQPATSVARAVNQDDWAGFARVVLGIARASACIDLSAATNGPHPASVIALRLIWGAERFAELPTVMLRPPPASFLEQLTLVPTPARQTPPEQLDQTVFTWLQESLSRAKREALPATNVRSFARVVAASRVVGQLRKELALDDGAIGYLAWARLMRADPQHLSNISSGWWSSARE